MKEKKERETEQYCWRCKLCGHKSPIRADICENPACRAQLNIYGEPIPVEPAQEEEILRRKQEEEKKAADARLRRRKEELRGREEKSNRKAEEEYPQGKSKKESAERVKKKQTEENNGEKESRKTEDAVQEKQKKLPDRKKKKENTQKEKRQKARPKNQQRKDRKKPTGQKKKKVGRILIPALLLVIAGIAVVFITESGILSSGGSSKKDQNQGITVSQTSLTMTLTDREIKNFAMLPDMISADEEPICSYVITYGYTEEQISFTAKSGTSLTVTSTDTSVVEILSVETSGNVTTVTLKPVSESYSLAGKNTWNYVRQAAIVAEADDGSGETCRVDVTVEQPFQYTITSSDGSIFKYIYDDDGNVSYYIGKPGTVKLTMTTSNGNSASTQLTVAE